MGVAHRLDQVGAALGHVAVDAALVLVDQGDPGPGGGGRHAPHLVQDLAAHLLRLFALVVEGEHAHEAAAELIGAAQGDLEAVEVGLQVGADRRLADGGAHARDADAGGLQPTAEGQGLLVGQVEDVAAAHASDLHVAHAGGLQTGDLLPAVGGDLVGEAGEGDGPPHGEPSGGQGSRQAPAGEGPVGRQGSSSKDR